MGGQFWMVLADNSNQTNVRHDTRDRAQNEAKRLAGNNPGIRFFVLQSIGAAVRLDPVSWHAHTDGFDAPEDPGYLYREGPND